MVGDRMDTDIVSGLEAGLRTDPGADRLRPGRTRSSGSPTGRRTSVDSVADLVDLVEEWDTDDESVLDLAD